MIYRFIDAHRAGYPVTRLCRTLGVSPSGYYAWRQRPPSARTVANQRLVTHMRVIGNEIKGQYGPTCQGVVFVTHGEFTNYVVDGNTIEIDGAATTGGCWGIAADNGGYDAPIFLRNAVFSRNVIKNGGNTALSDAELRAAVDYLTGLAK